MQWWLRLNRSWGLIFRVLLVTLGLVGLGVSVLVLALERSWATPEFHEPEEVFKHRTIGTEFVPRYVLLVLPDIFPELFPPINDQSESWIERYGFIRRPDPADRQANYSLPVGFTVTNYAPSSAAPSPIQYVGLSCAACHSVQHRLPGDAAPRPVIYGAGNAHMDQNPFFEAFRATLLLQQPTASGQKKIAAHPRKPFPDDEVDLEASDLEFVLSMDRIRQELKNKHSIELGLVEGFFLDQWLDAFRAQAIKTLPKYDYPFWGLKPPYDERADGRLADYNLQGPGRTQPFRTLVNGMLGLPANGNRAFSKVPAVFNEEQHVWSQFDGSIRDHYARSALAAMTAGATPDSLDQPELSHNIKAAAEFTKRLRGPTFRQYFGVRPTEAQERRAQAGKAAYDQHCYGCHGRPRPDGAWEYHPDEEGNLFDPSIPGAQHGRVVPAKLLGTDPARVDFRYGEILSFQLYRRFTYETEMGLPYEEKGGYPMVHTLLFKRADIRGTGGYVNTPIDSAFARAPFLHNASVMTLAELINLKERRPVFYRGVKDEYDIEDVGLLVPTKPDPTHYYRFDSSLPGNSNAGHNYPWRFADPARDEGALKDLLEYLKTF